MEILQKEKGNYFYEYACEDFIIGMRFANHTDAPQISNLYINEYGYDYVDPVVYSSAKLFMKLWDTSKNIWMVGENLIDKEIAAVSLLELNKKVVYSGKTILNPKFRGINLGSVLSYNCLSKILELGLIDNYIKIDSAVRPRTGTLRLTESANGIAYGFFPDYHVLGDKRNHPRDPTKPFNEGYTESAFLYFAVLPKMHKCREEMVYIFDDELLFFLYDFVRNFKRTMKIVMKNDRLIMSKGARIKEKKIPQLEVVLDPLNSRITILGASNISYMKKVCKMFRNYHIIIWKIPTSIEGINSMKHAFELGFKAIGYDVASIESKNSGLYHDSVIFTYYNKEVTDTFENIKTSSKNKELFERIETQFY
ncbi:MAG: hypothetical protein ACFFC3_11140 [Candidatus Odinarchaeota archaeon]